MEEIESNGFLQLQITKNVSFSEPPRPKGTRLLEPIPPKSRIWSSRFEEQIWSQTPKRK